jgi:hypothetical protein
VILGFAWWVLTLGMLDFLVLGWLVSPHYSRADEESYWPGWALGWCLIVTTAILWLGGINLPVLIWQNPMNAFVGILAYAGIGVIWSVIHWWLWRGSERQRKRLTTAYAYWKAASTNLADHSPAKFRESPGYPYGWNADFPMILTWVLFWPLDIFFYVMGDFIFNLASAIGRKIAGIYSAIGKGIDKSVIGE